MRKKRLWSLTAVVFVIFVFAVVLVHESTAWARAGGGKSFGSRGSRSYSSPSSPSSPYSSSPYGSGSGFNTAPRTPNQPYSSGFTRSPFAQGLLGGLAGGFLGSLLFGGSSHAAGGAGSGGGIGMLEIILIGGLIYFGLRFFRRRQQQQASASGYYGESAPNLDRFERSSEAPQIGPSHGGAAPPAGPQMADRESGLAHIRQFDPSFSEEGFRELAQDMFFRIQAGWMNRSLNGIESMLTREMAEYFQNEFNAMMQQGRINRLENIAVRKVEIVEVWQETGMDFITVLFTANLLDYTVDDRTNEVVEGDRLNPVKFEEYWTFCRDVGARSGWKLSAIQQTT